MEASSIEKFLFSIEVILIELVQVNVLVNKKTPLGDSFRRRNTPKKILYAIKINLWMRRTALYGLYKDTDTNQNYWPFIFIFDLLLTNIWHVSLLRFHKLPWKTRILGILYKRVWLQEICRLPDFDISKTRTFPHALFKHFIYCLGTSVSRNVF